MLIDNMPGEMELSFMNSVCSAANLAGMLADGSLPPELQRIIPIFEERFASDDRGTRLGDLLAAGPDTLRAVLSAKPTEFDKSHLNLIKEQQRCNTAGGSLL
jgi:hypothetical protein